MNKEPIRINIKDIMSGKVKLSNYANVQFDFSKMSTEALKELIKQCGGE